MRRGAAASHAEEERIHGEPREDGEQNLQPHEPAQERDRHLLGEEYGNQLVGGGEEYGHKGTRRDHAARIERRGGRRETALGHNPRCGPEKRAPLTDAPELPPERAPSMRLHPFQHQVGGEEERKQQQILDQEVDHAAEIASFGHVAAQAPQSTHLSASIV